jgi:hypothetical protein
MRERGLKSVDNALAIVRELRPMLDVIVTHNRSSPTRHDLRASRS